MTPLQRSAARLARTHRQSRHHWRGWLALGLVLALTAAAIAHRVDAADPYSVAEGGSPCWNE